ncbi:MAG: hypothetical protein IJU03_00555 [Thermoguttaceae bacterium]|nr:hypothetical protein [Thermoguttaceae bacterium]
MNIYEEFDDRDALITAIVGEIQESRDENGRTTYRLANREAEELRARNATATRNAERAEKRCKELERRLETTTRERDESRAKDAARRSASLDGAARERIAELEAALAPLKEENAKLKAREARREIEAQLVETARKLNCCETALRDVRRLAPMCALGEDGRARTEDERTVEELLREEIALSPHWLNRSQGSAARSNGGADGPNAKERFHAALERDDADFNELIRYAPRENMPRPF